MLLKDDINDIMLKLPPTLSILDNKYTILYAYVNYYQLPLSFFTLKNNKVYSIYDLFNNFKYYDIYFNPLDILMTYYESKMNINEDDLKNYKQWIINNDKKTDSSYDVEYNVSDLIEWYNKYFKKHNQVFENYLKNEKIVYYNENVEDLLKSFSKTGNIKFLNQLVTTSDMKNIEIGNLINPSPKILSMLNNFNHINYDSKSFMEDYISWIKSTHQKLIENLADSGEIIKIHNLLSTNKKILTSTDHWEKLVKMYNPYMKNRRNIPIDIYDGIDLFNYSNVSAKTPYIIYKDYNELNYYKVYEKYKIPFNTELNINNLHYIIRNNDITNYDIEYNLNTNTLKIEHFNIKTLNVLAPEALNEIIPNIELDNVVDYNMNGYVYLWDIEYDEGKLLNYILNTLNKILFVDDKNLTKKSITLKYIPIKSDVVVGLEISQLFLNEDKQVEIDGKKIKLTKNKLGYIPYIQIKFKNLFNYDTMIIMMKNIIGMFVEKRSNSINKILLTGLKKEKDVDENLKKLKSAAPDVFVEGYANFCDVKKRPTPIDESEIKNYIKNKSLNKDEIEKFKEHGVLDFKLANDEIIHLICDYEDDKYPYLKSTLKAKKLTHLDKNIYPELPCCKTLPPKLDKNVKTVSHITGFSIINNPGHTGELKPNVKYFLQYYNKKIDNDFIRLGTINDTKSFLHCICLAMQDDNYKNSKDKSQYVIGLLIKISENINFSLLKQELYDYDEVKMKEMFLTTFLDPKLYYRAFEEYYKINIYVLGANSSSTNVMELPRFNMFHARPNRDRKTILIYKHDNHCELIINHNEYIFDSSMGTYCHSFMMKLLNTYTITSKSNYNNMYSYADHLGFLNQPTTYMTQYIDNQGKLRALTFDLNNDKMTLITIPSQPENLPVSKIEYCQLETALNTMTNKPTKMTVDNGLITGLWYNIYDLVEGEYIPIKADRPLNLPVTLPPSIIPYVNKEQSNYEKIKKMLNFILQIIQWIFVLSVYQFNIVNTVDEFFDTFITISNKNQSIYETILSFPRRFPIYDTFDEYMDYIHEICPELIENDQIIMYNEEFNNQIKTYLNYYNLNYHKVPLMINDYYNLNNFDQQINTLIFLNNENLSAWQSQHTQILNTITPYSPYPFLYQHLTNQIFIIQYVDGESLDEALSVCEIWEKEKRNIGHYVEHVETFNISPTIYKTDPVELVKSGDAYTVLDYHYRPDKVGKYAAMLPI